jgi:hypothetical protein
MVYNSTLALLITNLSIFLPCYVIIALYNLTVNGSDHNSFTTTDNDIEFAIIIIKLLLYSYIYPRKHSLNINFKIFLLIFKIININENV